MTDDFNTFDFLINDDNEVMLLLYAQENEPQDAYFHFDYTKNVAIFIRNESNKIFLSDIPEDVLERCRVSKKILVCELSKTEKEEDTEIVYAYEANVIEHNIN